MFKSFEFYAAGIVTFMAIVLLSVVVDYRNLRERLLVDGIVVIYGTLMIVISNKSLDYD